MVSFFIVARNAEKYLPGILTDILNQDYPKEDMEFVLIDGESEDKTLEVMNNFKNINRDLKIKTISNYKKILASGWNIGLSNSTGNIILRVDAHSKIPSDFVRKNVESIAKGENIVGGQRITVIPDKPYQQVISLAEMSKFGAGSAAYRNYNQAGYVDTLAHAAYSRRIFEVVGGYDERLVRTEDNEMHYRLKKHGFKFYYNPEIKSFHVPRGNLQSLLRQKYSNGLWIGLTIGVQPKCFGVRHFIPLFFVAAIFICILSGVVYTNWYLSIAMALVYLSAALFFSFESMQRAKANIKIICLGLPLVFFLMHFAYGLGTIIGLVKIPYFVWKNRNYNIPFPIKAEKEERQNG